jgi:predicted DNA-binding ribbon-helix-helix protein
MPRSNTWTGAIPITWGEAAQHAARSNEAMGAGGSVVGSDDVVSSAHADAQGHSRACYNPLGGEPMKSQRTKSLVVKRTMVVAGRKTSIGLEEPFWEPLRDIAKERGTTLTGLIRVIDRDRSGPNLSSALRVFVVEHYQNQLAARTPSA